MEINAIKDMETLTSIPNSSLIKLSEKLSYCICEALEEALLNEENVVTINLDFGKLIILKTEDSIKYRFVPSAKLNDAIVKTVKSKQNPLMSTADTLLVDKITAVYKELL